MFQLHAAYRGVYDSIVNLRSVKSAFEMILRGTFRGSCASVAVLPFTV
jgi:hypothetical protein